MFAQLFNSNSVLFYQISRALFFCYRNSKSSIKYIQLPTVFFSTLGHEKSVEPPSFPFVPYAKRTQNIKWSSSVYHCKNQLSLGPPFCWWRLEVILRSNLFLFVLQASWQRRKKSLTVILMQVGQNVLTRIFYAYRRFQFICKNGIFEN